MDKCTVAGVVGKRGSGKTTLLKTLAAKDRRVLFWDWRGEYDGQPVGLSELPALFRRRSFTARYRPADNNLVYEFNALCHVVRKLGAGLSFVVDEVALVTPSYQEGGLGLLLRYSRPQGINLYWATQRPTRLPGVLISEVNQLYVFHLHNRADLSALGGMLSESDVNQVRSLAPHQYLTVHL